VIAQVVFVLQGFGLVLTVLALLWLVSALLGRLFGTRPAKAKAVALSAPSASRATAAVPAGKVPAAHIAAITAAVAVATSGRGRIVRVHAPAHGATGWVGVGRAHQALGHRTRWDWNQPTLKNGPSVPAIEVREDAHS